jgi:hypothetical protein
MLIQCRSSFVASSRVVLNKCDLLQAKLMRGAKIRDSVPSFGDRRNDVATATRCMSRPFFIFSSFPRLSQESLSLVPAPCLFNKVECTTVSALELPATSRIAICICLGVSMSPVHSFLLGSEPWEGFWPACPIAVLAPPGMPRVLVLAPLSIDSFGPVRGRFTSTQLTRPSPADFQQHFKEIQRTYSPVQRPFYVHLTSVIVRPSLLFPI